MQWPRLLAYISGRVDKELLVRNVYLAAENRILRAKIKGRLQLSDVEKRMCLPKMSSRSSSHRINNIQVIPRVIWVSY